MPIFASKGLILLLIIKTDKTLNKYSITANEFPPLPVERWILEFSK